jgi:hypothetical protein
MRDDEEIDPGEPIAALAKFEHDTSSRLVVRVRRTIQRRTTVGQLTSFSAEMPLVVLREFWLILATNSIQQACERMPGMEQKLREAFAGLGNSIASAIPKVCVGILLIILGLVVAKLVEVALRTMLIRVRFDSLIEKAGVARALKRIGLTSAVEPLLSKARLFSGYLPVGQNGK